MLNLTSWCQNVADLHSFPSMYDVYRQHRSNAGENDDWIQKNTQSKQKFWKKSLFRLLLLANTFYGCLFKTSNQIENGTIDFLFKMHLVWSLEVPKNQKCLEKVTQFSENFVFFRHFILMFLSYFLTKLRKKIIFFYKIFMFYLFSMHRDWFGAPKNLNSKSNFVDGPEKSWPSTWHCLLVRCP